MKERIARHKAKITIFVLIAAVLTLAFFWGGNYPKFGTDSSGITSGKQVSPFTTPDAFSRDRSESESSSDASVEKKEQPEPAQNSAPEGSSESVSAGSEAYSESQGMDIDAKTGKDRYLTDPVPEGKPVPVEPQNTVVSEKKLTCTLSVRCDTILNNMELLEKEKWELVPGNGVIFPAATVTFYEGESVFNVLLREMKKAGIQMEYENTPLYNSAYIEGIHNLYEFDVGELSGWMYKVNGWFPNYGCSRYQLMEGDVVEWMYTCNLGKDVGGYYSIGDS